MDKNQQINKIQQLDQQEQVGQRMYKDGIEFLQKQKKMLEDEHAEEMKEHEFIIKQSTCSDLEELGLAVNKLKLKSVKTGLYGRTLVTFAHPHYSMDKIKESPQLAKMVKLPESKFQSGDNVSIYKQSLTFDGNPLEKGVIFKKNDYKFVVAFDEEINENQLSNEVISIVMEVNEVTYNRFLKCLQNIEEKYTDVNFKGSQLLRVLLDGSDPTNPNPNIKPIHVLNKPITEFYKKDLNEEQKDAINFCLSSQTIGLIHGPPGTGKTMTVCELIYQAVKMGLRVLACAGSNIAVDNMVERLAKTDLKVMRIGHPARMLPTIYEQCLDNKLRKTTCFKELKALKQNINKQLQKLQKDISFGEKKEIKKLLTELRKEMREQEQLSIKEVIQDTQVVCCTNSGAADYIFKRDFGKVEFDLVVIDECAQALELSCWIPILLGKRVVLAGDHKQLPPTIKSQNQGLSVTLFDRVLKEFKPESVSRLLKVQYRMNEQIMEWSSQYVYGGQLKAHESVATHSICGESILLFIDTAGAKMGETINENANDRNKSKSNLGEADLVKIIFEELKLQGLHEKEVGVITPYNAQVDLIKKLFENNNINTQEVEVSTVDGFQGREKECIIISMVRSNPLNQVGFLSDYRRMNVAVTRARKFVCLIGDSETVSSDKFLDEMVKYFQEHGEVRSAMEYVGMQDVHFNCGFIDDKAKKESKADVSKANQSSQQPKPKSEGQNKKQKNKEQAKKDDGKQKQQGDNTKKQTENSTKKHEHFDQEPRKQFSEEELKSQYTREISIFLMSSATELKYDQINSFQRRVLHELAESFKLYHESIGNSAIKDFVIRKIATAESTQNNKLNENDSNSDDQEESKQNKESGEQKQDTKNKKKNKKKEQKSKQPQGILIGTGDTLNEKASSTTQNIIQSDVKQPQNTKVSLGLSSNPVAPQGVQDDQKNQYQEYVLKKQQEQQEKLKQQQQLLEQQKQQQQQKKANKQKNKDKKEKKEDGADELDDLAFLEKLAEEKKYCKFQLNSGKKCGVYVEMLGSDCMYCDSRYCIKHGLPEDHGCGDKVKKDAREAFQKQFMMQHRGEKPLRQDQLNNLQSKLQDKIKQNIDGRKVKQPEKNEKKK
ncbi:hypothetical protein ABPG74_015576 [Tetrahymena malaccensis]